MSRYTITLYGQNQFGIGESLSKEITTPSIKPNIKMAELQFVYKSKSTLLLKWKKNPTKKWCSNDGEKYSIMYKLKNENNWKSVEVKKDKTAVSLDDIQEKKKYEFKYFLKNNHGRGPIMETDYKHVKTRRTWPGVLSDRPVQLRSFQAYAVDHETINVVWIPDPINMRPIKEFKISWGTEDPYEFEKTFDEKQFQKQFHQLTKLKPDTEYTISAVVYSGKDEQSEERFERVRTKALNEKPGEPINVNAKTRDATTIRVSWSDQLVPQPGDNNDLSSFLPSTNKQEEKYYQVRLTVRLRSSIPRKNGKKPIIVDVKTGKRNADISNLRPFTTYDIDIRYISLF